MVELFRDGKFSYSLEDNEYLKECVSVESIINKSPFRKEIINMDQFIKSTIIHSYMNNIPSELAIMRIYFAYPGLTSQENDLIDSKNGYIYLIHSKHGTKIGRSKRPINRISQLQTQMPFRFKYAENTLVKDYCKIETLLHKVFANKRLNGEWFNLEEEDINKARDILKGYDYSFDLSIKNSLKG